VKVKTLLITYELKNEETDAEALNETIKEFGLWWNCIGSVWIIKTKHTPAEVCNYLASKINSEDILSVFVLKRDGAWTPSMPEECASWLRKNL
jgi:hypothetical protein